MRRLLGLCAGAVILFAAFLAVQQDLAQVSAAGAGNLSVTIPSNPGCPAGSSFTFCNEISGATNQQVTFIVTAAAAVQNVATTVAATPGLASNFAAGDFALSGNTCGGASLAASASCTIGVIFSPTKAGLRQATLTVTDSAGDSLAINLAGTGSNLSMAIPAPPACPAPAVANFSFCQQAVGTASGPQTFTLTSGTAITGLNIAFAAIPGLASEFSSASPDFIINSTTCTNSLPALGHCAVQVEFTPHAAGLRSAALAVTDTQGDALTVPLEGFTSAGLGISYPAASQACLPAPGFQFCNEPVGGTSSTTAFRLTNNSGTQVTGVSVPAGSTIQSGSTASDFTVMSSSCTPTMAANATCTFNVAFTPQAVGLRQGVLTVTDNQGDLGSVNLSGTGDDYTLALASGQTSQLTIVQGGTATFMAQVNPIGAFGANGEQVSFICPANLPANTSCAITPCPAKITAGAPATFQIVLVTSSATAIAPNPTGTGCTGYGPPPTAMLVPGPAPENGPGDAAGASRGEFLAGAAWRDTLRDTVRGALRAASREFASLASGGFGRALRRGARFPAASLAALLAAAALFIALFFARAFTGKRTGVRAGARRVPIVFAAVGIAAAMVAGCHHSATSSIVGPATPLGISTVSIQGAALDASGNPLNAARSLQITVDVVAGP